MPVILILTVCHHGKEQMIIFLYLMASYTSYIISATLGVVDKAISSTPGTLEEMMDFRMGEVRNIPAKNLIQL